MKTDSSARNGLGEAFQANWIPLSLIGVGIAWLLAGNTRLAERLEQDERVRAAGRRAGEIAGELGLGGGAKPESKTERGGQTHGPRDEPATRPSNKDRTDGWVHQAAGAARGAINSVRDAGSAALDRASKYADYAGDAGDLARRASGQLAEKLERDPWLIGVLGLVAGGLVAALLPPTRIELESISEAREGLWSKAAEVGHEAADRVRELAESTTQASKHHAPRG
jgi:hypothetical protein